MTQEEIMQSIISEIERRTAEAQEKPADLTAEAERE